MKRKIIFFTLLILNFILFLVNAHLGNITTSIINISVVIFMLATYLSRNI
jgi:hypothetical protein